MSSLESAATPAPPPHHGIAPHPCGFCCTRITRLGVRIAGHEILRGINLHLHCGELTVIIGPNGAGKSILLRALLGEVSHAGRSEVLPVPQSQHPESVIGYVPQKFEFDRFLPLTVQDLFAAGTRRFPAFLGVGRKLRATALASLKQVEAEHLIDRRLGVLSGGEMQRVLLALALTPAPNVLLLDEPVSGVDAAGRDLFYRVVSDLRRRFDLAILMVSHDLAAAAAVADRMIFLNHTVVAQGSPQEVLGNAEVRDCFGLPSLPVQNSDGLPA